MLLYEKVLNNNEYLNLVRDIENIKFITNGKWDWDHGLAHFKRVSLYVKQILEQLKVDDRTIELGMTAALLHDIGLSKGDKINHAVESSRIFQNFIDLSDISEKEKEVLRQAIYDHSNGNDIQSLIGLSLVLADKLDVTYHRTINSSIQDKMNQEIHKIKSVNIDITDNELFVTYTTELNFDISILKGWDKSIMIPSKVAKYLGKKFAFFVNNQQINTSNIFDL